jgi:hypothetical protein
LIPLYVLANPRIEGRNVTVPIQILFLKSLLLTDAIETGILFLIIRLWFKISGAVLSNGLLLFAGIYCSATTLPYLWFVMPHFRHPYQRLRIH